MARNFPAVSAQFSNTPCRQETRVVTELPRGESPLIYIYPNQRYGITTRGTYTIYRGFSRCSGVVCCDAVLVLYFTPIEYATLVLLIFVSTRCCSFVLYSLRGVLCNTCCIRSSNLKYYYIIIPLVRSFFIISVLDYYIHRG